MKHYKMWFGYQKEEERIIFFLIFSTGFNISVAAIKIFLALMTSSIWFAVNALFSIVLSISRLFAIRDYHNFSMEKDLNEKVRIQYKNYRNNGILLILLAISYFFVSSYMYFQGPENNLTGGIVYLVALFAFTAVGNSIYGMVKYSRKSSLIFSGIKNTNFANAVTSIVLTQVVLLENFGTGVNYGVADSYIGMIASGVILLLGFYMIIFGRDSDQKNNSQE